MSRRSTRLVSPAVEALRQIDDWAARTAVAGIVRADGSADVHGPDVGPVRGPERRPPRLRADGSERLGARVRASRRQGAALDGALELTAHLRPFRRGRDIHLG